MKGRITAITKLRKSMDRRTFLSRLEAQGVNYLFPWMVLSTRELAKVLGVPLQNIHNWNVREQGPIHAENETWKGNRTYYPLANVIAWLEDVPIWTVYRDWVSDKFTGANVGSPKLCEAFINQLISKRVYSQPRWKLKRYGNLPFVSFAGRSQ